MKKSLIALSCFLLMAVSACAQELVLRIDDILALDWKDYEKDCHGKPTFRIVTKTD